MEWLTEHFLLVMLAAATVFAAVWLILMRKRLDMHPAVAVLLAVAHTAAGVFCVKAFAFLESGGSNAGGMSLYGAIFFLPVLYYFGAKLTKRPVSAVFDLFTICIMGTLLLARINCIFSGCCIGKMLPGSESLRWPTREMEIVFYIVMIPILIRRIRRNTLPGSAFPIYLAAYGSFRFFVEFLRESEYVAGIFHISHLWSVIAICIGASVYLEMASKQKVKNKKSKKHQGGRY